MQVNRARAVISSMAGTATTRKKGAAAVTLMAGEETDTTTTGAAAVDTKITDGDNTETPNGVL